MKYSPDLELVTAATDYYEVEPINRAHAPRCEVCGKPIGMRPWLPPYRVELELWHKEFGDIAFGPCTDLLISERFKRCYESAGLTGFLGFEPVEVVRVKKRKRFVGDPPPYYHVTASLSRTAVDLVKSGFEMKDNIPICSECLAGGLVLHARAIVIDSSTWSGEDVFISRAPAGGIIVTSERFKEVCEANGITNAVFIPAEEYSFDFYKPKDLGYYKSKKDGGSK
ncbi:MAG: hypothetical protein K6U80_18295 [Firmicutes bacterium]|nr:hypothetical protein [Bacillota bacterium]